MSNFPNPSFPQNNPNNFQNQPFNSGYQAPNSGYQPPKKSGNTVWIILSVVIGLTLLGIVGVCGGGFMFFMSLRNDSTTMRTIQTPVGISQISIPDNWTENHENPDADIEYGNLIGEKYVIVLTETKTELESFGMLTSDSGEPQLQKYCDIVIPFITQAGLNQIEKTAVNVNGADGFRYKFKGKMEGIPLVYWATILESSNHFHQINVWTLANREETNRDVLLKVMDSYTIQEGELL